MGYFPNGTSGGFYEEEFCSKCVHQKLDDGGCAVWHAHMMHNYKECNNEESILHMLIPRNKDDVGNKKCLMFHQKSLDDSEQDFTPPLKGEVVRFRKKALCPSHITIT